MSECEIAEYNIPKLDIEGAERQVFDAGSVRKWISRVKVIIMECPDNEDTGTTMTILQELEFNCFIHSESIILIRSDVTWTLTWMSTAATPTTVT